MKIARATKNNEETFGLIKGKNFFEVKSHLKHKLPTIQDLIILINQKINNSNVSYFVQLRESPRWVPFAVALLK